MDARGVGTEVVVDNHTRTLALNLQLAVIGHKRRERPFRGGVQRTVAVLGRRSAVKDASLVEGTVEDVVLRITAVVVVRNKRVDGRRLDGTAEDGIVEQGVVGPETLQRVTVLDGGVEAVVVHCLLPNPLPLVGSRNNIDEGRVLGSQQAHALQHEVALDEDGVGVDLLTIDHTALYRLGRTELVLLVAGQLLANEAVTRVVEHNLVEVIAIGQRTLHDVQQTTLGLDVGFLDGNIEHLVAADGHPLGVKHEELGRLLEVGSQIIRKVVAHEGAFHHRVAPVGGQQVEHRVLVERTVDGSHHGERLPSVEQVGIAHAGLLVLLENLGLAEHLAEVAQFGSLLH